MARDIYTDEVYEKKTKGQLAIRWAAPESVRDGQFTTQTDCWSFGVLLYEMVTLGSQPFQGLSRNEVFAALTKERRPLLPPEPCPKPLYVILKFISIF